MFIVQYTMDFITTMQNSVIIMLYATIIGLTALLITFSKLGLVRFNLRPCQHDNGFIVGRSQIDIHTDELTHVHRAQSSLVVTRLSILNFSESATKLVLVATTSILSKKKCSINTVVTQA